MGYLGWDSRFFSGVPYLDGVDWTAQGTPLELSWSPAEGDERFVIPVASGEHVLQSPICDDVAADQLTRYVFTLPVQLFSEDEFRRLLMAEAKGTAVRFIPHLWCMEHWADQSIAAVRSLSRPVAWTLASGVTSVTHPAVFYKDGVVDTNCVALSGTYSQVVTVAEAGDIAVWYMPAFSVVVKGISGVFQDVNAIVCEVTLEEVRRYA